MRFGVLHVQLHVLPARSQNQQRHFVSNAHVPLHANFHCNPSLLATINCEKVHSDALRAQLRALRARYPKTNNAISSATPMSPFMPTFVQIG